jgi:hypothetical protein
MPDLDEFKEWLDEEEAETAKKKKEKQGDSRSLKDWARFYHKQFMPSVYSPEYLKEGQSLF